MPLLITGLFLAVVFLAALSCWLYLLLLKTEKNKKIFAGDVTRRMYELSILQEIGSRIGYSLNIEKILDIITGSLPKLLSYSTVSFMLFEKDSRLAEGEKIVFKITLAESVSKNFVNEVKKRMVDSLAVLAGKNVRNLSLEATETGMILDENPRDRVESFFNIPLVINEELVGLLTIASKMPGLYKEEEMTILYKIVDQASSAVSKLQQVLEAEKGKLNAMVASMADGVLMIDQDNQIVVSNPAVKSMMGYSVDRNLNLFDIAQAFTNKIDFRAKLEESLLLGRLVIINEVLVGEKYLQILISPVKFKTGENLGTVILCHDITHDKQLERMREDFIAMMVHELRTPLTVVRGTTDTLLRHPHEIQPQTVQELLLSMKDSATNMLSLVSDLLDAAKIEAGKFEIHPVKGDLEKVITNTLNYFQNMADEKNVKLITQFSPNTPPLVFDKERINQVLNNLLSNALKFTSPGGQVTVSTQMANGNILVSVQDTGVGIPKDKLGKIFSKFEQIEAPTHVDQKGTGLGLAIVKGIIETHGGNVQVSSEWQKGSIFSFSLPLEEKMEK